MVLELVAWQIRTSSEAPLARLGWRYRIGRGLDAAGVVDPLASLVPVPPVKGRGVARSRVLDHEGRNDVLGMPSVPLLVRAVEVRLRRLGRLERAVGEVADRHAVLVVAVTALRRHRGDDRERAEEHPSGKPSEEMATRYPWWRRRGHVSDPSNVAHDAPSPEALGPESRRPRICTVFASEARRPRAARPHGPSDWARRPTRSCADARQRSLSRRFRPALHG